MLQWLLLVPSCLASGVQLVLPVVVLPTRQTQYFSPRGCKMFCPLPSVGPAKPVTVTDGLRQLLCQCCLTAAADRGAAGAAASAPVLLSNRHSLPAAAAACSTILKHE